MFTILTEKKNQSVVVVDLSLSDLQTFHTFLKNFGREIPGEDKMRPETLSFIFEIDLQKNSFKPGLGSGGLKGDFSLSVPTNDDALKTVA